MKYRIFFICIILLAVSASSVLTQEMIVSDSDGNVLIKVNDEGDAGSLTIPPSSTAPAEITDKLHNVNGVLFWKDAQLGTGWSRTGTNVHLINASDNVGIGTETPGAKLEVSGQVKITGGAPGEGKRLTSDAEGLATWETVYKPAAEYAGGNLNHEVTENYGSYGNPKSVTITVPAAGKILVSSTGTINFASVNWDLVLFGILANWQGDPNSNWSAESNWYNYLTVVTDCNCADESDQYSAWSNQRGFTVNSGGTYTFRLWTNKHSSNAAITLSDINMFAEYFPN